MSCRLRLRRDLHVERHRLELIRKAAQDARPGGADAASGRRGRRALRARGRGALSGRAPPVELLLDGIASEECCDRHVGHLGLLLNRFKWPGTSVPETIQNET
jgi:hypothetical protein